MAKTVLIVEDERAIVEILKFNLKREGYETLEALDGQTGLQLAQTEDPDLISRPALHAYALALTHPVTGKHELLDKQ